MAPSNPKSAASAKDKPRKSSGAAKDAKIVVLKVSPDKLQAITNPTPRLTKEDTPMKDMKISPDSTPVTASATLNADNPASDSAPATPGANGGTPAPSAMGPPDKKKGVKRSAGAAAANGEAKAKGKPGPKKRQRLEDGTLEPARGNAHRLGPKANQGAINAGLRALDRSGKPCRKWNRGGFRLKTFTGVEWEIPRWTAPPKPKPVETTEVTPDGVPASAVVSTASSSKENHQDNAGHPAKSDISNSGGDVEMQSIPSIQASSPVPMPTPVAAGA
ncbi:hypothetical protein N0V82_005646 [Gnomoniopsis sp. IMI 355080]|nr:hypothetical protein N0V82_005646 [Gnomoniopsis sp. IMI 355080]